MSILTVPETARSGPGARATSGYFLAGVVAAAEVVDEHLFDGLVVGDKDVADGVTADKVADFFGKIFGVIAGALEGLGHEDDLQAGLAVDVLRILDVAQEDEVAETVHFGVSAKDVDSLADLAGGECGAAIGEHFFEDGRHLSKVPRVFGVDASADGEGTVGEAQEEVADALEANHELHAGEEFAGLGGTDLGDGGSDAAVDFPVERIQIAFALAQRIEEDRRTGGDALGRSASRFLGHVAGFDGAANDVLMRGLGIGRFHCGTHDVPPGRGANHSTACSNSNCHEEGSPKPEDTLQAGTRWLTGCEFF